MGFDEYTKNRPLMDVKKPGTKSNLLMVIGVVVFFIIVAALMFRYLRNPAETRHETHQEQMQEPNPGD